MSETILTLWKKQFKKNKNDTFVWDNILGMQTKRDFMIKAYFISTKLKKIPGSHIGIMMPAVSGASLLIIASYLAGKTPVMFNWTLGKEAFDHCVELSKVDNIVSVASFYDRVKTDFLEEHKEKGKFIFLESLLKDGNITEKIGALLKSFYIPIPKLPEQAVILFTSGSESLPKAVPLTHKNIIADIKGSLVLFPLSNHDRMVGFLPPFHSFGFTVNTILPLISGLEVAYTPDPNDAKTILEIIKHTQAKLVATTPTFLKMVMNLAKHDDLSHLRYAVVGAEKCPEDVFKKFEQLCPNGQILEGYGITECSPIVTINPVGNPRRGSIGKAIGDLDIKILSLDDNTYQKAGEQGMIYVNGPSIFNGYLDDKLESPFESIEGKEYYKTGDLGYLDEDGYLYITGRLKRFIKIAGEMISLPFIEGILSEKYSSDNEVKIAIEALEKDGNAKIILFSIEHIESEEVNDYLRKRGVSNLIKISDIIKIAEIPLLGTGKTDYKKLKGMIN